MDLIFHGPLGMELSLDRSAGVPRVKAAEHDSPALLVVGRALTAIEGVPVGEIRDKKSWLAVVAKLQAPERPLSLSFEAPAAPPPEEDPVAAEERARAELQPVAERAECALSTEHIEERFLARERARMAKDYRTADAIEKELTLAGVNHNKARWWIPGTSREGPMPCARDTGALCRYYSAGRPCPHGDRCQFLHADDSRPGERVPVASSARRSRSRSRSRSPRRRRETSPPRRNRHDTAPPGLGQRPTRRHLVSAAESARVPQPPVESEPAARGPTGDYIREPPDDDAIFDMVLAQESARIARDYATADRMRAEMAAAGLTVVYRDATGRPDKSRGAVTWYTNDGRTGPPSLSTVEIESRLRAWIRARDVDQNHSRTRDLLAECAARGIGRSENWNSAGGQWFTAHGQRGPMPSLEGDTPAAPPVPSAGRGALRWFTIDGRTGPPKMSEREIDARLREWVRAREDNMRLSHELRADLAARGVRVAPGQGWYTAGPNGLSGPMPSLDRKRSRSRSPRRSRHDTAPGKRPRPPSPPGLGQRPTRRHLVAAAPAPSEASSSDGF
ncbi:unnamed protein product [Pelagomonas calceolata]|uniref:C3H1-type domain-containing protein n=2 Tax=Pelagomonas calceolata TaxID=35677 RepID=A0A8J2SVX9_9STRA|nr:unnamed protein product [Pelagomonas calceolata]